MASARITITLAQDKLSATADVTKGKEETINDLWLGLAAAGVRYGIDEDACRELGTNLKDKDYTASNLRLATGNPGKPGDDGEVRLELGDTAKRQRRQDGSLDHRERSTLHTATQGAHVATYHRATLGENGRTVTDEDIEHPAGEERIPTFGPGVEYDTDDGEITAAIPGLLCFVPGKSIDVTDLCINPGDVNYESGNLRVDSSLRVEGNVLSNFEIAAAGDVIIDGQYCSGTVYSKSNIHVAGGITGGEQATKLEGPSDIVVCAEGNITCRHANGATLTAGAMISFGDHCINSWVTATDIELLDGRGKCVGGELQAINSIKVTEVGSPAEQRTILAVGLNQEQQAEVSEEEMIAGIKKAEVVVVGIAHPGVIIRFGRHSYTVNMPVQSVRFTYDEEEECVQMAVMEINSASAPC